MRGNPHRHPGVEDRLGMGFFKETGIKHQHDLMIDLETLGIKPGYAILSIGACIFAPEIESTDKEILKHSFYANIDRASCVEAGLLIDPDTELWWSQQSDAARLAFETPAPRPLEDVIQDFVLWMRKFPGLIVNHWANSPSFDYIILKAAFEAVGARWPFPFYKERDVRTLKNIFPPAVRHEGEAHNALDDAVHQARQVQDIFKQILLLRAKEHAYDTKLAS